MHGRVRVKTTAEQQEAKNKERAKKLQLYRAGFERARQKRENGELDDEGLSITGQMLAANPDIYTLWNFRREIILHMRTEKSESDFTTLMENELLFVEQCLLANPKSYSCWHQREWTLGQMTSPNWSNELQLCNKYLELDDRNFHCWDYRRFVTEHFTVDLIQELEFTDAKIASNFSNYSSWHYRSKLLPHIYPDPNGQEHVKEEKLLEEFDLVQNAAFTDPNDQSAWFYNRWLLGKSEQPLDIICMYFNVSACKCCVVLNKHLKANLENTFRIEIDGKIATSCQWSVPPFNRNSGYSNIWIGTVSKEEVDNYQFLDVYYIDDEKISVHLAQDTAYFWKDVRNGILDAPNEATKSVLQKELESCKQLHELEPDNKWALFTSVLLMRELNFKDYYSDILLAFKQLEDVDPLRKGHYKDLRSKFVIEDHIKEMNHHSRFVGSGLRDLSNQDITAVYHTQYMINTGDMNLSCNHLVSLKFASVLHFVHKMDVSGNEIEDCDGLQELPYLNVLNLSDNKICELDALAPLGSCTNLEIIFLDGNPVVKKDNFNAYMKELVPKLRQSSST